MADRTFNPDLYAATAGIFNAPVEGQLKALSMIGAQEQLRRLGEERQMAQEMKSIKDFGPEQLPKAAEIAIKYGKPQEAIHMMNTYNAYQTGMVNEMKAAAQFARGVMTSKLGPNAFANPQMQALFTSMFQRVGQMMKKNNIDFGQLSLGDDGQLRVENIGGHDFAIGADGRFQYLPPKETQKEKEEAKVSPITRTAIETMPGDTFEEQQKAYKKLTQKERLDLIERIKRSEHPQMPKQYAPITLFRKDEKTGKVESAVVDPGSSEHRKLLKEGYTSERAGIAMEKIESAERKAEKKAGGRLTGMVRGGGTSAPPSEQKKNVIKINPEQLKGY